MVIVFGLFNSKKYSGYKKISINNTPFFVEIADTDEKRTQGLSGRDNMPENRGMLFVFGTNNTYSFWMKDMRIPLDFIWIDENTVVDITENIPPPDSDQKDSRLPLISPGSPVNKVLEVNAGFVAQHNIKTGDVVSFDY